MQSGKEDVNNFVYDIFEDKRVIKYREKHKEDTALQNRIDNKYLLLSINPDKEAEDSFKSPKCPKCKKTRIGDYRMIYFIHESRKEIEIIDFDLRKKIYKKWD